LVASRPCMRRSMSALISRSVFVMAGSALSLRASASSSCCSNCLRRAAFFSRILAFSAFSAAISFCRTQYDFATPQTTPQRRPWIPYSRRGAPQMPFLPSPQRCLSADYSMILSLLRQPHNVAPGVLTAEGERRRWAAYPPAHGPAFTGRIVGFCYSIVVYTELGGHPPA
jgi:hypothetical protein